MSTEQARFTGTSRFQLLSRIGAGGMGVVYEALDVEKKTHVALKTLPSLTPNGILRFKNEFHALQDLHHPNLVSLGELISEGGQWFFTMELVDGVDFLTYVRPSGAFFDELRLRAALEQLAEGLVALHAAQKIHRDIKPSNIMVTAQLRVVLLDFGLALDLRDGDVIQGDASVAGAITGSPPYMSPEQVGMLPLGPETDWYSVGVVLYEALTGKQPLEGSAMHVLMEKRRFVPPRPRTLVPRVPDDLDQLAMELLSLNPAARPTGEEVLRRLGALSRKKAAPVAQASPVPSPRFVGREAELAVLERAFLDVKEKREPLAATIEGESGIGKSALLRQLSERLRLLDPRAVILAGRCYEKESVPYKALDGVIDELSGFLRRISREEAALLLPRRAALLPHVFPVLGRVEVLAQATRLDHRGIDPQELRARVFSALRELLLALAERRPLVLVIDDLQWADEDSLMLLGELLHPPDSPPLLLIATARTGGAAVLSRLSLPTRAVALGPLSPEDGRTLAGILIQRTGALTGQALVSGPPSPELAAAIAGAADGHPLFIDELVRHTLAESERRDATLALDDAVAARVDALIPRVRHVLTIIATASSPLREDVVAAAAEIKQGELSKMIGVLRAANLVRASTERADAIEPYHDRVRVAVLKRLPAEHQKLLHSRLAIALETSGRADPEGIAVHWDGAGEPVRAADHAFRAADQAAEALAFDRAARLYAWTLKLGGERGSGPARLSLKLANALAYAGRSAAAAEVYREAAKSANNADETLELERAAAEQLLRGGHVDAGLELVEHVLEKIGIHLAPSPKKALLSLLYHRARLRLRGLKYRRTPENEISAQDLLRIDITWSIAAALGMVDTIRGADFQTRNLLLALKAGEPSRIARSLAVEACFSAAGGFPSAARTRELVVAARALAEEVNNPHALGLAVHAGALEAFFQGRFAEARKIDLEAEQIFLERCYGAPWEVTNTRLFTLSALSYMGEVAELAQRLPLYLKDALERGDLYRATDFRTGPLNIAWLASDDAAGARREAEEAINRWSRKGFHVQHYDHLIAETQIDLYLGQGVEAQARMAEVWPKLRASLLMHVQFVKIDALFLRARCALAAVADPRTAAGEHAGLLALVRESLRVMEKEKMPVSRGYEAQLLAAVLARSGDRVGAVAALDRAIAAYRELGMQLFCAGALRRRGELAGDAAAVAEADTWMSGQKIRVPAQVARMVAPGF